MICEKCGMTNEDGAKFCVGCGNVFESDGAEAPENFEVAPAPAADGNDIVNKVIKIAVPVAIVVVVLLILSAFGVFKSGAQKAFEKYYKAFVKGDGKTICELSVNPYDLENLLDNEVYDDKEEMIEKYVDDYEDVRDDLEDEYGKNVKAKIEIKKITKYDKNDIKNLNEYLSENYDDTYEDDNVLQDIKVIKAKITIKGSEDDDSDTEEYVVYKMKGKWYVGGFAGLYDKDSIKSAIKSVD